MGVRDERIYQSVGDHDLARRIIEVKKDVAAYFEFEAVQNLGLGISYKDLPFETVLLFSWIKEGLSSGRKT